MKNYLCLLMLVSLFSFGQETNDHDNESSKDTYRNRGYFNITKVSFTSISKLKRDVFIPGEGGFYSEPDSNGAHAWSLQTINGYFISPYFSLGVGLGLDGYHKPSFNTLPVFLDIRVYANDSSNSLFSFVDIGPTIRIGGDDSDLRKGFLFNAGLGYKFNVGNRICLVSDLFYSHKTVSFTDEGIATSDDTLKANGIGLGIGIIF